MIPSAVPCCQPNHPACRCHGLKWGQLTALNSAQFVSVFDPINILKALSFYTRRRA